eukprot:Gregarina_sp_Poly_1__9955@NODE_658_length_6911_cov_118_518703_g500_i0_p6_GENE_NODE_658_length_6911_cov_118_518703_g500_i0NODE_658_length_6911_cov_118_518703_g500_i0_p6_ORF_typecomplete_len120_score12_82Herpes_U34/PF04541_13/0_056_NODE_658_length_6911_cov_118_518703_g500_i010911450
MCSFFGLSCAKDRNWNRSVCLFETSRKLGFFVRPALSMSSAQLTFRAVGPDDMSTMLSMAHQVSIHVESERHFAGTAETFNRAFGFSHEGTPGSGFVSGFVAEYDGQIAGGAIYFDHFK